MSAKLPRKQIFDVTGEDQVNADGSYRQQILQKCLPGQAVELVRQPTNPQDKNAIYICIAGTGQGIGYVSKLENAELAAALDAGVAAKAHLHELRGGLPEFPNFGCKICVVALDKEFRRRVGLRPEQTYYEHAPVWRDQPTSTRPKTKSLRKPVAVKTILSLFKGLFK